MSLLSGGKAALDWGAKGFQDYMNHYLNLIMPSKSSWKSLKKFLDPRSLLDPMGIARNIGAAFLSDDPITPGKLIESKVDANVTNLY